MKQRAVIATGKR